MAANDELIGFVRESLAKGMSRTQVEEVLRRAGWSDDQVSTALASFADVEFPIPVPRAKPYLSAREAFEYLLLFSTLYVSAFSIGALAFDSINSAFPDAAVRNSAPYVRESVRWSLSCLIVSFPVFLYLSAILDRGIRRDPGKRRSNVRRWLMYLTIFVASAVLIGDFTTLVYNALSGELTTRFVLKVLTVAAIAGAILGYYLPDLRLEDKTSVSEPVQWRRTLQVCAVAAAVAVVAAGLWMSGAPSAERERRLDARRVDDLQQISRSVRAYHERHKRLPASLDELAGEGGVTVPRDPATGGPYAYRVTDPKTYEVCATFHRDSSERMRFQEYFWSHGPGRRCFGLEAKPSEGRP